MPETYLSDLQIAARYAVHRLTPRRWPDFPKPIKLTPGCTRWKLSEIQAWENAKAESSAA